MSTKNALNNHATDMTLDPGASGDSYIQFDINTTGEFRIGVDDTASDAFKMSQGSALGTNDTFIMTAAGENTQPLQPAFLAITALYNDNVTGDGTLATIDWDGTEVFDQNGDFDGTSTFTSPVTGKYVLGSGVLLKDVASGHTSMYFQIVTSNRTFTTSFLNPYALVQGGSTSYSINNAELLCDMDASDTAVVKIEVSGGAKVVDVGWNNTTDNRG